MVPLSKRILPVESRAYEGKDTQEAAACQQHLKRRYIPLSCTGVSTISEASAQQHVLVPSHPP